MQVMRHGLRIAARVASHLRRSCERASSGSGPQPTPACQPPRRQSMPPPPPFFCCRLRFLQANLDRSKGERQCPSPCTPTLPRRRRGLALPALRRLVLAAASGTPTALSAQTVEAAGAGSDHPIDGLRQKSLLVLLSALSAELLRRDPRPPASVVLWSR